MEYDRFVLHCLFSTAWSDGTLGEEERELLDGLVASMDLNPDLSAEVDGWYLAAPSAHAFDPSALSNEEAEGLMRWVFEMASADLVFSLKEYQLITGLREEIGMSEETYYRLQGEVEDMLREESAAQSQ